MCPKLVGDKRGLNQFVLNDNDNFIYYISCSTTTERIWVVISYTIPGGELGPNTLKFPGDLRIFKKTLKTQGHKCTAETVIGALEEHSVI